MFCQAMKLSPVSALLLGVILGCAVTTLIHSLTVSCVQCGGATSRSLIGMDKFPSIASSDRFFARQLGMVADETSCATLRLQLETVKAVSSTNRRRRRAIDNVNGIATSTLYLL